MKDQIYLDIMQLSYDQILEKAIESREQRKRSSLPKNTLIKDIRLYNTGLPQSALSPYAYQYTEIFRNILRRKGFLCPNYHHLYIQVAKTKEEALRFSGSADSRYIYGVATIDYEKYEGSVEEEKAEIVFNLICEGLRDIAHIDQLDTTILEEAIAEIKKEGINTELLFQWLENKKYLLNITYKCENMIAQDPVFFSLTEKASGKTVKKEIGRALNFQLHYWLQKITLSSKTINVKASILFNMSRSLSVCVKVNKGFNPLNVSHNENTV